MGRIIYLLDTNVLSEPARIKPNDNVMKRFENFNGKFATASIVWHELVYGCALLPNSKRKSQIQSYLSTLLDNGLVIFSYNQSAAEWFGRQRASLQAQGKTVAYADGEIAAVAAVNNLTLVTGNTDDFQGFENLMLENWFD